MIGSIELPMPVGLIGSTKTSHTVAKVVMKILGVESAEELAGIIASVGLAQNFAGLKALAGKGIQEGHMKLHARNIARMVGAKDDDIDKVVELAAKQGKISYDNIKEIVLSLREGNGDN